MNYSRSLAQGFTFLSVMVTAANMPLYLMGALGLFLLWHRQQVSADSASQGGLWLRISAVIAALYVLWAFVGIGTESLLWVSLLGAVGLPVYWGTRWWRQRSNPI